MIMWVIVPVRLASNEWLGIWGGFLYGWGVMSERTEMRGFVCVSVRDGLARAATLGDHLRNGL